MRQFNSTHETTIETRPFSVNIFLREGLLITVLKNRSETRTRMGKLEIVVVIVQCTCNTQQKKGEGERVKAYEWKKLEAVHLCIHMVTL
jgi:hypothetical protein